MSSIAKKLVAFSISCLLLGCASQIAYVPKTNAGGEEGQAVLAQLLREAESGQAPLQEVQVTKDYFKCTYVETRTTKFLFVNKGITTVPYSTFVYFNNIGRIALYKKGSGWIVLLVDKGNAELFQLQIYQESKAKAFVDAIVSLSGLDPATVSEKW